MKWDAAQYLKFEAERTQPAADLTARLQLENPKKILDIGCGPGNSTRLLKDKYPSADVFGIDKSPEMIEAAKKSHPDINFQIKDAEAELKETGGGFDVVFSNAAIQWIPNHEKLIPEMMALVNTGGILGVQIPMTDEAPMYEIVQSLLKQPEWENEFASPRIFYNSPQNQYYEILSKLSDKFSIWETIYFHLMPANENILEWYRGTGIRPYLEQLTPEKAERFEKQILEELKKRYPKQSDGTIIMRFPRLFFTAEKRE